MNKNKEQQNGNVEKAKLYLAIAFFFLVLTAVDPWVTGVPFHEWASFLLFIPLLLVHIQIDWKWIVAVSKRVFKNNQAKLDLIIFGTGCYSLRSQQRLCPVS